MDYSRQIATAQRLITKYGAVFTWRKTAKTADPTQPWKVDSVAVQNFQVSIMLLKGNNLAAALQHLLQGSDVTTGAPDALMPVVPFTPEMTDQLIDKNGKVYAMDAIDPLQPSGLPILYKLRFA